MGGGVDLGSAHGRIELDGSGVTQTVQNIQQQLKGFGTAMSLGVTAPLLGISAAALSSAGDFEQSMNMIAQSTQGSAESMAALQAQALQLGAETSFSAGEAAAAMLEMSKAGMSLEDVSAGIGGVLDLAAAGGLGLADAATIAANTVNAFNLSASETPKIANMLAAAANASSADVSDLAAGMQQAGAVFASNDQSVQQLASSLAILANNGIAGSDAGTSLKTMLMSLAAPTDKARGAMSDLGIMVYDSQGQMRDFGAIIGDLSTATATMSDAQRNAAFSTIFGSDAIRAASILAREGATGFAEMTAAVGAQGAAAEAANARMAGFNGAIEYLKGSIDSFLIGTALPFLASFSGIVRSVADAIAMFGSLPAPVTNAALAFTAVLAAVGPLALGIGGVAAALGVLLSPIGLVTIGVAALAAAWTMNLGGIQQTTAAVVGPITEGLSSLGAQLGVFLAPAVQRVQEAFVGMPAALAPIMPQLAELGAAVGSLMQSLQPFVMLIGAGLAVAATFGVNALAAVMQNLPGIVGPVIQQVTATLQLISTVLTAVIAAVRAAIDGDWAGVWTAAQEGVNAFATYYRGLLSRLGTFTSTVGTIIYEALVNTMKDLGIDVDPILKGIQKTFETVWGAIQSTIQGVIDIVGRVTDTFNGLKDFLTGLELPNPVAPILDAVNSALNGIGQLAGGGGNGGGSDGNPLTPWAGGTSYFPGGMGTINERGYEQIVLPAGSRIMTNGQTNQMQKEEPRPIMISFGDVSISKPMDAHQFGAILRDQLAMASV